MEIKLNGGPLHGTTYKKEREIAFPVIFHISTGNKSHYYKIKSDLKTANYSFSESENGVIREYRRNDPETLKAIKEKMLAIPKEEAYCDNELDFGIERDTVLEIIDELEKEKPIDSPIKKQSGPTDTNLNIQSDNTGVHIGAARDLYVYHDGVDAVIDPQKTGLSGVKIVDWSREGNSFHYQPDTTVITYNGLKIQLELLKYLSNEANKGSLFRYVKKENEMLTVETMPFRNIETLKKRIDKVLEKYDLDKKLSSVILETSTIDELKFNAK